MKRKTIALLCMCMAFAAVGCGDGAKSAGDGTKAVLEDGTEIPGEKSAEDGTGAVSEEETKIPGSTMASVDIKYDVEDYVTLGDYTGIEVTLNEADYEVTEDKVNSYVDEAIYYANPYPADETKTVVGQNDIVDVNYVGKKDGTAFDGGSAENQIIDVANNCEPMGNVFIDGFTDGLVGAKVGETVDSEVTFPEDYGNEELNGQTVTFSFTVNAICKEVTRETLDDAYVLENFQSESVEAFFEESRQYVEESAEANRQSDIRSSVIQSLMDICTIKSFPEGVLEGRMEETLDSIRENYCTDGTDLDTFLQSNYQMTEEEFREENMAYLENSLTQEMILEAISKKENIEFNQDEFDEYISNIVSSGGYTDAETLYASLRGTTEAGERYFKKIFLANKACDLVAEQANVTYTKEEEGTEALDGTEASAAE